MLTNLFPFNLRRSSMCTIWGPLKSTLALFNTPPPFRKKSFAEIGAEKEIPALPKFMGLSRVLLLPHICTYMRRTKLG